MMLTTSAVAAPVIERAIKGERCVEDTANMRRNHMRFLEHQRDATVHGGIRGARHSLKGCIDCHASKTTGSVAQAKTDFCVACHAYTAVKIDCFDCHATRPASAAVAPVAEAGK
jgi:formate-dependent nitrite reductase cytochrome c552 subunit